MKSKIMNRSRYLREHATDFIKTGHYLIHYLHAGSGRPLVLIHGGGVWLYSFRHNMGPLSGSSSVYAIDMPGYGYSSVNSPYVPFNTETMSGAIKEFMDKMRIQTASILGHSWGGGWALAFAEAYPSMVERIVLVDSSGLDVPDVFEWELLKIPLIGPILLRFLTRGMVRDSLELSFHNKHLVDDDMAREIHLPLLIAANRRAQASISRNLSWADVENRLGEIRIPVLLIWGEMDRYLDVGLSNRFRERIRHIQLEIIHDCGHCPHEEVPEVFNRLVRDFLCG